MKYFLGFLAFVLMQSSSFAQVKADYIDVKMGEESYQSQMVSLEQVIPITSKGYYTVKSTRRLWALPKYEIEHFDEELNLIESVELDLGEKHTDATAWFAFLSNQELYFLSKEYDKKARKDRVLAQKVDLNTLEVSAEVKELVAIDHADSKVSGVFNFRISEDSSKLLFYYDVEDKKREKDRFSLFVLDKSFNLLWKKDITMPYEQRYFEVEDFRVDNFGEVHLIGKTLKKEEQKDKKNKYEFEIFSYLNEGKELKKHTLRLDNYFINELNIAVRDNKDIICTGFYSEKDEESLAGTYYLAIDGDTRKIKAEMRSAFELDFIMQNKREPTKERLKERKAGGKNVELRYYKVKNIILKEDGGIISIAELAHVATTTRTNSQGQTSTSYTYINKDILVLNMDNRGKMIWKKKIPKMQVDGTDFFSSYAFALVDNNIHLIFNDNLKNLTRQEGERVYNFQVKNKRKNSIVSIVKITPAGKVEKRVLFIGRDIDTRIRASKGQQINSHSLMLSGKRRGKGKLILVDFK